MNDPAIATGVEFEPQPDGTVIIEFFADDGKTVNTQAITRELLVQVPLVAFVALTAMEAGTEVAKKLVLILRAAEEAEDGDK